jgi:trans-2,3-dihydro-3-hydroxyanthranilate isomerase
VSTYSYYTADVFSDRIFGGNPLAVFPEASGLTPPQMQKIAAEFNFSETVFVFPPETPQGTKKVRIFTPSTELPFAGHPTVGTAYILALIGAIPPHRETTIYLEEGVGLVPVKIVGDGEKPVYSELKVAQLPELVADTYAIDDLAAILSLSAADFLPGYPPRAFSCGLPFLFIPVKNQEILGKIKLNMTLWSSLLSQARANSLFVFCFDSESPHSRLYGRMFAPGLGVMEDPATGSAVAALGGYLGGLESSGEGMNQWTIIQGVEMGRPSCLQLKFQKNNREITEVCVGGASVLVCQGKMIIPDEETKSRVKGTL